MPPSEYFLRASPKCSYSQLLTHSFAQNFVHEGDVLPDPHMSGISHLLQLRGRKQASSKYTRSLLGWATVQIVSDSILQSSPRLPSSLLTAYLAIEQQIQAIATNRFDCARVPEFIESISNPDCVVQASILNSVISQFCQSAADFRTSPVSSSTSFGAETSREIILASLLARASYLLGEVDIWNASIPSHWRKQYQSGCVDFATISPPDPWTITFLAITKSAQIVFYLHVLFCCTEMRKRNLEFSLPEFPGGLTEFCDTIENRLKGLLDVMCYTVSATIGFVDATDEFQPMPTAKFANSNTLLWPMWIVINCPLASEVQVAHCRRALNHIGRVTGHGLALSLSNRFACAAG